MKENQKKVKENKPKTRGRKWFDITPEDVENGKTEQSVIAKIEEATAMDATVKEILYYADISKDSYYRYLKAHPKFREKLEKLRQYPMLKARRTIIESLKDPQWALKYAEKKKRNEFGNNLDITSGGEPLQGNDITFKDYGTTSE